MSEITTVYVSHDTLHGTCGISLISDFMLQAYSYSQVDLEVCTPEAGCGYVLSSFIEGDPLCDKAYEILKNRWKIVFESPKELNINSGNQFYFCIYKMGDDEPRGFDHQTIEEYKENPWS